MNDVTKLGTDNQLQTVCKSCGAKNPEYVLLCSSCGTPRALEVGPAASGPTYSAFVIRLLSGLFVFAIAVFDSSQLEIQAGVSRKFLRPALISLVAFALVIAARKSWTRDIGSSAGINKNRQIVTISITVAVLLVCTAILFGVLIGKSRRQVQMLDGDLSQYATIGKRISKARNNAENSIPAYIQMYEAIEPDVIALQSCSSRLIGELRDYDNDFPEFHEQTQRSIANVSTTQRRMLLLLKQIEVAERLRTKGSVEQRATWDGEMVPLAQEEDKLDSDSPVH